MSKKGAWGTDGRYCVCKNGKNCAKNNAEKEKLWFLAIKRKTFSSFFSHFSLFCLPLHPQKCQRPLFCLFGGMVEWSITTVLKTVVPRGTGGSNPSPSANWSQWAPVLLHKRHFSPRGGSFNSVKASPTSPSANPSPSTNWSLRGSFFDS